MLSNHKLALVFGSERVNPAAACLVKNSLVSDISDDWNRNISLHLVVIINLPITIFSSVN